MIAGLVIVCVVLVVFGVLAIPVWFAERPERPMYVDEEPQPDQRDKLAEFRRWQAQRKVQP